MALQYLIMNLKPAKKRSQLCLALLKIPHRVTYVLCIMTLCKITIYFFSFLSILFFYKGRLLWVIRQAHSRHSRYGNCKESDDQRF